MVLCWLVFPGAALSGTGAAAGPEPKPETIWSTDLHLGVLARQGSAVPSTAPALSVGVRREVARDWGLSLDLLGSRHREGTTQLRILRHLLWLDLSVTYAIRIHPRARLEAGLGTGASLEHSLTRVRGDGSGRLGGALGGGPRLALRARLGRFALLFSGRVFFSLRRWQGALLAGIALPLGRTEVDPENLGGRS